MPESSPLNVTLYMRVDCSLCDEVRADLQRLQDEVPHRLTEIDIDSDPVLQQKYHEQIPVVEVGPYVLRAPISRQDLAMTLGAARDRRSVASAAPPPASRPREASAPRTPAPRVRTGYLLHETPAQLW